MTQQNSAKNTNLCSFPKGTVILRQGEADTQMFFVLKGEVELIKSFSGKEQKAAVVRQGEFFGEYSLVGGIPRDSSAVAASDVVLMSVTRENFNEVISKNPQLALHIITALVSRLHRANPAEATGNGEKISSDSAPVDLPAAVNSDANTSAQSFDSKTPESVLPSPTDTMTEKPDLSGTDGSWPKVTPEVYAKYCFEKDVTCPVCERKFKADLVRESRLRLKERTEELRSFYSDIEPLFFNVWVCPHCLYSAKRPDFDKLTEIQKRNLSNQVDQRKKYTLDFNNRFTPGFAIAAHKIAIDCCDSLGKKNIDDRIAGLWLNIAWLYDNLEQPETALEARQIALAKFKNAYTFGTDRTEAQDQKIEYLIGKLSWVTGDIKEAKNYLFKVANRRNGHQLLKQMARDGLDQLKKLDS